MSEIKKTFHIREVAIAIVVALSMFITGLCLDWNLSSKVFDINNTSAFGIVFAGLGTLPLSIGLMVSGLGLIVSRRRKPVWAQVLMIIAGVLVILAGVYFTWDNAKEWHSFRNTQEHATLLKILEIIFTLLVTAAILVPTYFLTRKTDKEMFLKISIVIILTLLLALIVSNIFKYLWGRQRPRSAFAQENPSDFFDPWWSLHPFRSLIYKFREGGDSDDFKSFPSGHSVHAASAMLIFPLLTLLNEKTKNLRPLQIGLFYLGLVWGFTVAISRLYAGAHYLSDTSIGMLTTILMALLTIFVLSKTLKDRPLLDKDVQA